MLILLSVLFGGAFFLVGVALSELPPLTLFTVVIASILLPDEKAFAILAPPESRFRAV